MMTLLSISANFQNQTISTTLQVDSGICTDYILPNYLIRINIKKILQGFATGIGCMDNPGEIPAS
jgi:hypothetical protein